MYCLLLLKEKMNRVLTHPSESKYHFIHEESWWFKRNSQCTGDDHDLDVVDCCDDVNETDDSNRYLWATHNNTFNRNSN